MAYKAPQRWSLIRRGGNARIAERYGISPFIASIILNRGISDDEEIRKYLYGTLDDMEDPYGMEQIGKSAELLHKKISEGRPIRVIGDYDADGITSTYILCHCLKEAGAIIDYDIPDRVLDGYGMSMRLVEKAHSDGIDTIITCDNGISQIAEIRRAKELGMTAIVTDHHEPNYTIDEDGNVIYHIPEADAVIDPKLPGCRYPNKNLCGAGVVWKLIYVYEQKYSKENTFPRTKPAGIEECPLTMEALPFAAIATVTDIMKLTGENRILVKYGMKMLKDTVNPGICALIEKCKVDANNLVPSDIGYRIGPCLNASGRLESAKIAADLLLEHDKEAALEKAAYLVDLNEQRKAMTENGKKQAIQLIEDSDLINDRVLVLYLGGVHESVVGIIASKVKDTFNRPAIVFTDTEDPGHLKGSGRSIEKYNMHAEFTKVSDAFIKFGGHPMAAGATIKRDKLNELRKRLNENCTLVDEDLVQNIKIDVVPPFSMLNEELADQLKIIEPCGPGNRGAVFGCSQVKALKLEIRGHTDNCVKLCLQDNSKTKMEAVYFSDTQGILSYLREQYSEEELEKLKKGQENSIRLTLAYKFKINYFKGEHKPQIQIEHFQ